MKKLIATSSLIITALIFTPVLSVSSAQAKKPSPQTAPNGAPASFADLTEQLLPAVVNISSIQKAHEVQSPFSDFPDFRMIPGFPQNSPLDEFFEQFMERNRDPMMTRPQTSQGSGFVIDAKNGYIVTNGHVIDGADEVRVTFHDDVTLTAEVIGHDEKTDIAVLKVTPNGKIKKFSEVKFGDSDTLRVGDWILAIGNPFGLGGTVTAGIISARQRDINSGPYDDYLQTDASINRGNSGGPMFNLSGEVIGINTAIFSPTGGSVGIGFAIPSALAKPVIDQIIEYGHTRRGWLGVHIQSVTEEIAESLGLEEPKGALVAAVTKGGPAEKAGLKAGDILLNFNGQDIPEMRDLPRIVAEAKIDSTATVTYWSNGQERTAKVKVGELEKAEENGALDKGDENWIKPDNEKIAEGTIFEDFGLRLDQISPKHREEFDIRNDIEGLVILEVTPDSEASQKGLFEGDVIMEINQQPTLTITDAQDAIAEAKKGKRDSVLILLSRTGDVRFIALKMNE